MSSLIKIEDGVFLCEHCGEEYTRNIDMERHFPCLEKSRLCETVADKQKEFAFNEDSQVVVIKKEIQELLCGNCGKDISEECFNIHDVHSAEVLYLCKDCRHLSEHDNIGLGLLQDVGNNFDKNMHDSASELIKNMQFKEGSKTDLFVFNDIQDISYQCEHCGEEYVNNKELLRHSKTHVSDRKYEVKLNKEDLRAHKTETNKALIEHDKWTDWKEFGNNFEQNRQYTVKGTTSEEAKKLEMIKGNIHGLEDVNITDLDIDGQEKLYNYENCEEKYVNNEELLRNRKTHTDSKFEFRLIKEDLRIYEKEEGKVQCQIKFVVDKQVKKTSEGSKQELPYFERNLEKGSNFEDCLNSDTMDTANAFTQCQSRDDMTSSVRTGHSLGGYENRERIRNINGYRLKRHLQIFHTEKQYECQHCKKRFTNNRHLKLHLRIHTSEKPFECEHCGKKFTQRSNLKDHLRRHTGEKPYECTYCDKKFAQRGGLRKHLMLHTGNKPFKCQHCEKKFAQRGGLNKHMLVHTGDKPYECQYCEKRFSHNGNLTTHLTIHTGVKPHECEHCKKRFSRVTGLKEHMWRHTGEKPFECTYCDKKFAQRGSLNKHLKVHEHAEYEFKHCEKRFRRERQLADHMAIHTGVKPYDECEDFQKKFTQITHLKEHLHTEEKQYECQHCGEKFTESATLKSHLCHAIKKPFECEGCRMMFTQRSSFIEHMRTHNRETLAST